MPNPNYKYVHAYLQFRKRMDEASRAGALVQVSWCSRPLDAVGWQREKIRALDFRIHHRTPLPTWRKLTPEYQDALRRDVTTIRDHLERRVRFYQLATPEMMKRYGHLRASYED